MGEQTDTITDLKIQVGKLEVGEVTYNILLSNNDYLLEALLLVQAVESEHIENQAESGQNATLQTENFIKSLKQKEIEIENLEASILQSSVEGENLKIRNTRLENELKIENEKVEALNKQCERLDSVVLSTSVTCDNLKNKSKNLENELKLKNSKFQEQSERFNRLEV